MCNSLNTSLLLFARFIIKKLERVAQQATYAINFLVSGRILELAKEGR